MLKLTAPTTSKPAAGDDMIARQCSILLVRGHAAAVVRGKAAAATTKKSHEL